MTLKSFPGWAVPDIVCPQTEEDIYMRVYTLVLDTPAKVYREALFSQTVALFFTTVLLTPAFPSNSLSNGT